MSSGRPTLGDVARIAKVHKATASRALNPATVGRVHAETARRVRAAADELGYRPNMNARGLRAGNTASVGVLIPNILSQIYPPMVRGIENVLRGHGFFALLADSENDPEQEKFALDNLISRQVDGLIAATHLSGRPTVFELGNGVMPVVFLEATPDVPGVSTVSTDTRAGVDALVDVLVACGHRRIAHLAGPTTGGDAPERTQFHLDAFARHGLDPADCVVVTAADYTVDAAEPCAAALLADHPEITAVMAYNDQLAIGTLRAARAAGLRCPEDLSVTGYNDTPLVDALTPPLTTVHLDTLMQGRVAAEVLMAMIKRSSGPQHVTVPVSLVLRGSHGPVRRD